MSRSSRPGRGLGRLPSPYLLVYFLCSRIELSHWWYVAFEPVLPCGLAGSRWSPTTVPGIATCSIRFFIQRLGVPKT
jgi:hypothetical protein